MLSVWNIKEESYSLIGHIGDAVIPGISAAKVIKWLDGKQAWANLAEGASVMSVLLLDAVVLIAVRFEAGAETAVFTELTRLSVTFRPATFCWSNNGTQLLVGGRGQMTCFTWSRAPSMDSPPQTRQYLCGGNCAEIHSVYNNAFICRVDHHAQVNAPKLAVKPWPPGLFCFRMDSNFNYHNLVLLGTSLSLK
eukprot:gnl/MRDRNA2_/MRDRNA2_68172_c0_seq1.p1 gnl/MRDRNA2_/MRDRNA2_68172_c0~~gnl/MRDRNA2_/MRDRNA2_68172_c0_seq1.p1  ORF type:complete len:193 (-),score=32.78 gnl/MRDRNA2_/MRDRNA2_68172_c0_seq1:94-672(-)